MKNWSSRLYPPSSNPPMGIQYASNQRSCSSIENGLTELGRKNQKTLKDAGNPTLKEKACKSCSTNVDFRRNGMIRKDHGILCYQQYCISCHKINISDKNNAKKKTRAKEGGCYECNLPATQGKYCQRHYDDYNEHNAKHNGTLKHIESQRKCKQRKRDRVADAPPTKSIFECLLREPDVFRGKLEEVASLFDPSKKVGVFDTECDEIGGSYKNAEAIREVLLRNSDSGEQVHQRRWLGDNHHKMNDNRTPNPLFDSQQVGLEVVALMNQCDFVFAFENSKHDSRRIATLLGFTKLSELTALLTDTTIANFYHAVLMRILTTDPSRHPDQIYVSGLTQAEIWISEMSTLRRSFLIFC